MTQDQQLQPQKKGSTEITWQNKSQRGLILAAINGERILTALNTYSLSTEMVLSDKTLLPVSAQKKESAMFVSAVLKETCQLIKNDFNDDSIADTAILLIDEFYHWKPEDFVIFFRELVKGKYGKSKYNPTGKIFGLLDAKTIFEAAQERESDREEVWTKVWKNNHYKLFDKEDISESESEQIKKQVKQIKENTSVKGFENRKKTESAYQLLVKTLFNQFWKEAKYIKQIQFIIYKDKPMTAEEWVEEKLFEIYPAEVEEIRQQRKHKKI